MAFSGIAKKCRESRQLTYSGTLYLKGNSKGSRSSGPRALDKIEEAVVNKAQEEGGKKVKMTRENVDDKVEEQCKDNNAVGFTTKQLGLIKSCTEHQIRLKYQEITAEQTENVLKVLRGRKDTSCSMILDHNINNVMLFRLESSVHCAARNL